MPEPPFDLPKAQRWFAVELNNLSWDLVEKQDRSQDETERMIHAAHAAVHFWLAEGTPINHLRGQCLLATAYAAARLPEAALRHAEQCLALGAEARADLSAFDRATMHGAMSNALVLAGRRAEAQVHYAKALAAIPQFEHPEDQAVFAKLYPKP